MEKLPIDCHLEKIAQLIKDHQNLVIKASPGSGKTTRIPPFLNRFFKKIMVLEPRRVAAMSASDRIANEQGWKLGERVGYQVRFDKNYGPDTEIIFLTEALLARKLLSEDTLSEIDLVILDEFHERSLWTDLCLGIIKEWQELGSPIKLLILSATLDEIKIKNYLSDCEIYQVDIPNYPVEVIYSKVPYRNVFDHNTLTVILDALKKAKKSNRKNIIVFLPGLGEILKTKDEIQKNTEFSDFNIEILHGNLPLAEQQRVLQNQTQEKNIILSTNIAESSVTINNVETVIDTGFIKISDFDIKTSVNQLNLKKISLASAEQRQGRSHRQMPGVTFKLWTPLDEKSMEAFSPPEVLRADLSLPLLFLNYLNIRSDHYFKDFHWFEPPSSEILRLTTLELFEKKLIVENKISNLGKILVHLNLEYHLGLFLLFGKYFGTLTTCCHLVALLQEKDILPQTRPSAADFNKDYLYCDLLHRLNTFTKKTSNFPKVLSLSKALEENFNSVYHTFFSDQNFDFLFENKPQQLVDECTKLKSAETNLVSRLNFIIDYVFIDRLCKRRKDLKGLGFSNTATNKFASEIFIYEKNNKSIFFENFEFYLSLKTFMTPQKDLLSSWIRFIPIERIELFLKEELKEQIAFNLHPVSKKISKSKKKMYGQLILKTVEGLEVNPEDKSRIFKSIIHEEFTEYKSKIPSLVLFYSRVFFLKSKNLIPKDWEPEWVKIIDDACYAENDLQHIINKDWQLFINNHLSEDLIKLIAAEAPLNWQDLASGKSFKIEYHQNEAHIESKLQNFLGLKSHPTLGKLKTAIKLVLLGPNGRPIQITKDLIGFWKTSYPEIRKELRGRYPKHSWPEDPMG